MKPKAACLLQGIIRGTHNLHAYGCSDDISGKADEIHHMLHFPAHNSYVVSDVFVIRRVPGPHCRFYTVQDRLFGEDGL